MSVKHRKKYTFMNTSRVVSSLLTILVIAIAALAAFSDIFALNSEPAPEPPPPLEELIPPGDREDKHVNIRVLAGDHYENMSMERYLIGVLAAEMPASFEPEALKAQAVAARTYAAFLMRAPAKELHPDADVCTDPSCCAAYYSDARLRDRWEDSYVDNIAGIIDAVVSTSGICMLYEGAPIEAVFHSSSAGMTEASGEVWATGLPYLSSVDSPETAEDTPGYISVVSVSSGEFTDAIRRAYPEAVFDGADESQWITDVVYTESGRIGEITIGGVAVRGTGLRSMFSLRSTAVTIEYDDGNIVFTVTGYGHGVGMSQYGANVMAAAGSSYADILRHYYHGVTLANYR